MLKIIFAPFILIAIIVGICALAAHNETKQKELTKQEAYRNWDKFSESEKQQILNSK